MPVPAEELAQAELQPITWGDNLAKVDVRYLGVHNNYMELGAIRPDGSVAMFGELTSSGLDGARKGFSVSDEARELAPGRALVSQAVQSVMELEKLTEPDFAYPQLKPPVGDWEPETIATQGLGTTLSELSLTRSLERKLTGLQEVGWIDRLNEILAEDDKIAVGLHDKGSEWSIIKLLGFQEYEYTNPVTSEVNIGLRPAVKDRHQITGLRPENSRIERAFIKRN